MRANLRLLLVTLVSLFAVGLSQPAAQAASSGVNDWSCQPSAAHPRPVVLIHGLGAQGTWNWSYHAPRIAAAGYCVFYTTYGESTPGFGGSAGGAGLAAASLRFNSSTRAAMRSVSSRAAFVRARSASNSPCQSACAFDCSARADAAAAGDPAAAGRGVFREGDCRETVDLLAHGRVSQIPDDGGARPEQQRRARSLRHQARYREAVDRGARRPPAIPARHLRFNAMSGSPSAAAAPVIFQSGTSQLYEVTARSPDSTFMLDPDEGSNCRFGHGPASASEGT